MKIKTLFIFILMLASCANAKAYDFKVNSLCYGICTLSAVGINPGPIDSVIVRETTVAGTPTIEQEYIDVVDNYVCSADVAPQFPGGDKALLQCIQDNMQYPRTAIKRMVEGTVVVQFIVEMDGSVGETRLVRGVDFDLDREALRLCKVLPKFSPARNNVNEPVRMWYTIPIKFKITDRPDPEIVEDAELGDAIAQYRLGQYYEAKNDYANAIYWLQKSAYQGNDQAQLYLGILYANGYGVEPDPVKSAELVAHAAESGNAIAQNRLAIYYTEGFGVRQDKDKAIQWFIRAAEQGCEEAAESLDVLYEVGVGKQALSFFRQEAEEGNGYYQNILGNCYYYGDGVEQDYEQAIYWYQEASLSNNSARFNLAKLYAHKGDYESARFWLTIDYDVIPNMLGRRFMFGQSNAEDTLIYIANKIYPSKEYLDFLEEGASLGYSVPLKYLACIYAIGKDVNKDDKKAIDFYTRYLQSLNEPSQDVTIADVYAEISYHYHDIISKQCGDDVDQWLMKAAELGHCETQWRMVRESEDQEDYAQAITWLLKLAQQDDPGAECILGDYYEAGKGVTRDHNIAIDWYKRAAASGSPYAQNIIGECYYKGDVLPKDPQKAKDLFEKAIGGGDIVAHYNLGVCFYEGSGVNQDFEIAADLFYHFFEWFNFPVIPEVVDITSVLEDTYVVVSHNKQLVKRDDGELAKQACKYAIGKEVERNDEKAVKLFSQFLNNINEPKKKVTIADVHYFIYHNPSLLELDYSDNEEQKHLEMAAKMGLAEAQYELGLQYYHNEDYENAAIWLNQAVQQGHMGAQYDLARLYESGNGVQQDDKRAADLFKKAAKQGHMRALHSLGYYYSDGKGGIKDAKLANECFYKVATYYKTRADERWQRNQEKN